MAAPKADGGFFGGTFRGSRNPQGVCGAVSFFCQGRRLARQTKQNPGRRRAQPAFLSRCLRVRRA
jgi:hypothetical protein